MMKLNENKVIYYGPVNKCICYTASEGKLAVSLVKHIILIG